MARKARVEFDVPSVTSGNRAFRMTLTQRVPEGTPVVELAQRSEVREWNKVSDGHRPPLQR